ncbi:hypothetical protein SAY87_026321 [Trapa incisa]|uniref:Uncharacterized protein n=1 Tax=Trapa incisa TaxID=236973 RepID=A0AAN7GZC0_9MYRT|nr:hypothetical protein SAY87_026321 [Trapa incisa]
MSGRHRGVLQALHRQQSGIGDMQILQQQMDLRQLQDIQKQQFWHQGVWQQNSLINSLSSMESQIAVNLSQAPLKGIPIHDSFNKPWSELLSRIQTCRTSVLLQLFRDLPMTLSILPNIAKHHAIGFYFLDNMISLFIDFTLWHWG